MALVGLPIGAARARAGDRPQGHRAPFLAHQDLGGGAHHMEVAEVVIEHVRRRIERAQGAIQRQRRFGERPRHALRQHHLHHVAGGDVFLGARHRGLEGVLPHRACGFGHAGRRLQRQGDRRAQALPEGIEPLLGLGEGIGLGRIGVHDERDLAGEVVDHRELLGEQQEEIRHCVDGIVVVARARGEARLDVPHHVVAEHAGEAAAEARQARARRGAIAAHEGCDEGEGIALVPLEHALAIGDLDGRAARPDAQVGRQADE